MSTDLTSSLDSCLVRRAVRGKRLGIAQRAQLPEAPITAGEKVGQPPVLSLELTQTYGCNGGARSEEVPGPEHRGEGGVHHGRAVSRAACRNSMCGGSELMIELGLHDV